MLRDLSILYAEDEELTRENLYELLNLICNDVRIAKNGQEAYDLYVKRRPDIIIADIEMPILDGLTLAQKIRKDDTSVQIIITTAYTNTPYFLKAVELNLIKYLIKPVTLVDLKDALAKASNNITIDKEPIIYLGDGYNYDLLTRTLTSKNQEIKLTNHEILFFELLIKNSNRAVKYEEIDVNVWGYEYEAMSSSALRSLVRDLRKKLPEGLISNISKIGYKIKLPN